MCHLNSASALYSDQIGLINICRTRGNNRYGSYIDTEVLFRHDQFIATQLFTSFIDQPEELASVEFSTVSDDLSGEADVEAESFNVGSRSPEPRPLSRLVELSVFIKFLCLGER